METKNKNINYYYEKCFNLWIQLFLNHRWYLLKKGNKSLVDMSESEIKEAIQTMTANHHNYSIKKIAIALLKQIALLIGTTIFTFFLVLFTAALSMGFHWVYIIHKYVVVFSYDFYKNLEMQDPLTPTILTTSFTIYILINIIVLLRKRWKRKTRI